MAVYEYKNSAWQEPSETPKKYVNSAWEDSDGYAYENGAWVEKWASWNNNVFMKKGIWNPNLGFTNTTGTYNSGGYVYFDYSSWSGSLFQNTSSSLNIITYNNKTLHVILKKPNAGAFYLQKYIAQTSSVGYHYSYLRPQITDVEANVFKEYTVPFSLTSAEVTVYQNDPSKRWGLSLMQGTWYVSDIWFT